ncbi:MAG: hypothetical protein AB7P04_14985, partial [Bacteriovoracia bacterium]
PNATIEAIDAFESMDDFSKAAPPFEPPADPQAAHFDIEHHQPDAAVDLPASRFEPEPASDGSASLSLAEATEPVITQEAAAGLEQLKEVAASLSIGTPDVTPSYPFTLRIDGQLRPSEREKLMDLINREKIGFREIDLEPQFEAGSLLLPRISEYAAVLIAQALRDALVSMRLTPADDLADGENSASSQVPPAITTEIRGEAAPLNESAESLPLLPGSAPEHFGAFTVVGSMTATLLLKTRVVEARASAEYQDALESLQRQIRYQAFRKGAEAVIQFSVSLTPVGLAGTEYRLMALGTAIRRQN